jgi:predicted ATPase with chaperone activity
MISDLKKPEVIAQVHLAEAILYRPKLGAMKTFFFSSCPKGYSK